MRGNLLVFFLVLSLIFIVACAPAERATAPIAKPEAKVDAPQPAAEEVMQPKEEISAEAKDLLEKHSIKVKSIYYKYKGHETGDFFYDFYVLGDKVRYNPLKGTKYFDNPESFDSIYLNKGERTAQAYCAAAYCIYKGKKGDLNYEDSYIQTILDWIDGLTKAKKIGEEVVDDRGTWKLETDKGIFWIDTFYGIPLKIESEGNTYRFQQISVNSVKEEDVAPPS